LCSLPRVSDIATGIALMLLGAGLAFYLGKPLIQPQAPQIPALALGFWSSSTQVQAALSVNALFPLGVALAALLAWGFANTRFGLVVRMAGDSSDAARALGYSVNGVRVAATTAGGFIAGSLTRYFSEQGYTNIRAIDRKPLPDWYLRVPGVESISMDLSHEQNAIEAVRGAKEVYNLAADMGGMGFIENFRVECLRSILVNTHLTEASYRAGVSRYFFSSSACAYNTDLQKTPEVIALKESDAYPAMAERGYGWEKLISEMFCQEYWAERGLETHIARFHNIYGPNGTWFGGREKAPAAMCRKVIEAKDSGKLHIDIWGTGEQTRSFCFIEDCVKGIDMIMHCEKLIATPINLGSSELVSINRLVSMTEEIGGVRLERSYQLDAPKGVAGRNSDNTMIQSILGWEPNTPLRDGMAKTYAWIEEQYNLKKAGKRVVQD